MHFRPLRLLARFAGMRQQEIAAASGSWIIRYKGQVAVDIRDREEEDYWHKTGQPYKAIVIEPDFAAWLEAVPPDSFIVNPHGWEGDRKDWFKKEPQQWARQFTGAAQKPLHRLRGLYADHLASLTEEATLARLEALKAASAALGHKSTKTTSRHYTSG